MEEHASNEDITFVAETTKNNYSLPYVFFPTSTSGTPNKKAM